MILEIIILLLAVPVGILISKMASDELKQGKKYFRVLFIVGILGSLGFWIYGFQTEAWTMAFVGIVSLVGFLKSGK